MAKLAGGITCGNSIGTNTIAVSSNTCPPTPAHVVQTRFPFGLPGITDCSNITILLSDTPPLIR
jgi:hypothetical protein